ncbi:MAG: hypothetical protein ACOYM3_21225 [Terrimicrobiaceae bacterium]
MNTFLRKFRNPDREFRSKPFWSWNGELKARELVRQVRVLKRMGFGGFFMHARVGLDTPYLKRKWFDAIKTSVREAKRLGFEAWLYDEDRWQAFIPVPRSLPRPSKDVNGGGGTTSCPRTFHRGSILLRCRLSRSGFSG